MWRRSGNEAGGTYGVSVSSQLGYFPKGEVALQTYFDTDPEKADLMNKIVREELQSIAKDGPRIEDFNKTKENMQKKYAGESERKQLLVACGR